MLKVVDGFPDHLRWVGFRDANASALLCAVRISVGSTHTGKNIFALSIRGKALAGIFV